MSSDYFTPILNTHESIHSELIMEEIYIHSLYITHIIFMFSVNKIDQELIRFSPRLCVIMEEKHDHDERMLS
jgi:hypothetical protein